MKNKTTRFLLGSLIGVVLLCVGVFTFFSLHMSAQSSRAINEVGTLYMSRMSQQTSSHFDSIISLQMGQLRSLADTITTAGIHEDPELQEELIVQAKARDFDYLGFCGNDGSIRMIYGSQVTVSDPGPFLVSLGKDQQKVAIGTNAGGEKVVLLGMPSPFPSSEEHDCVALVAGLPVDYISDNLTLEENSERAYSYIIRKDGSFVIRSADAYRNSYFERVRVSYESINGMTPEEYIQELSAAMAQEADYSNEFEMGGERYHLYCAHLPYSEWYLITFMPYGSMDSVINSFTRQWAGLAMLSAAVILAALLLVFFKYFQLTRAQLCVMLARVLNVTYSGPSLFTDVADGAWYAGEVNAMAVLGLVSGVGGELVNPESPLTQEEFLAIMGRTARYLNFAMDAYGYAVEQAGEDLPLDMQAAIAPYSDWAQSSVAVLTWGLQDVLDGAGSMLFAPLYSMDPSAPILREEAAAGMYAVLSGLEILP